MKQPDYIDDLRRLAVHAAQAFDAVGGVANSPIKHRLAGLHPKKELVLEAIIRKHRKRVMQQWQEAAADDT
ncbi:MAG: hypothetical protein AAGB04_29095 [Pseudomonadota bacterium]